MHKAALKGLVLHNGNFISIENKFCYLHIDTDVTESIDESIHDSVFHTNKS